MRKLLTVIVASLALSCAAVARERGVEKVPKLKLSLTAEKTSWRSGEDARVKVRIENASEGEASIPSVVNFTADNRSEVGGGLVTMGDGVFWSPVSLLKSYFARAGRCQNDLSPDRVETLKGTNIVSIRPAGERLTLKKGEVKEFDFDLAETCWGHSIAAFYPNGSLFSLAAKYGRKTYGVYFQMRFQTGTTKAGGLKVPTVEHLKSNAVEISID